MSASLVTWRFGSVTAPPMGRWADGEWRERVFFVSPEAYAEPGVGVWARRIPSKLAWCRVEGGMAGP